MNSSTVRILGIDPGLQRTGWGVIETAGNRLVFIGAGTIASEKNQPLAYRLLQLAEGLDLIIGSLNPSEAAMETTFVNADGASTLKLGQARGALLVTLSRHGLGVSEYAPNSVKKAVTGAGHADKGQIQAMVTMLLPKAQYDGADSADALAIAICHAHHRTARDLQDRISHT